MPKFENLSGRKFGLLTAIERGENDGTFTTWVCKCDCGSIKTVRAGSLKNGLTRSCGCLTSRSDYVDPKFKDLTGQRFGRLTVVAFSHTAGNRQSHWKVKCDCGNERIVSGSGLKTGNTKSCGCLQKERASESNTTHGETGTKIHRVWKNMVQRCTNPNATHYADYGGRGISVCDKWLESFEAFRADVGEPPSETHSLDRINTNGNYEPSNVKWSTSTEQIRNRRNSVFVTYKGKRASLIELCSALGIDYFRTYYRIVRERRPVDEAVDGLVACKEPQQNQLGLEQTTQTA